MIGPSARPSFRSCGGRIVIQSAALHEDDARSRPDEAVRHGHAGWPGADRRRSRRPARPGGDEAGRPRPRSVSRAAADGAGLTDSRATCRDGRSEVLPVRPAPPGRWPCAASDVPSMPSGPIANSSRPAVGVLEDGGVGRDRRSELLPARPAAVPGAPATCGPAPRRARTRTPPGGCRRSGTRPGRSKWRGRGPPTPTSRDPAVSASLCPSAPAGPVANTSRLPSVFRNSAGLPEISGPSSSQLRPAGHAVGQELPNVADHASGSGGEHLEMAVGVLEHGRVDPRSPVRGPPTPTSPCRSCVCHMWPSRPSGPLPNTSRWPFALWNTAGSPRMARADVLPFGHAPSSWVCHMCPSGPPAALREHLEAAVLVVRDGRSLP